VAGSEAVQRSLQGAGQLALGRGSHDCRLGSAELQFRLPLGADVASQRAGVVCALGVGYAAVLAGAVAFVAGKDISSAKANATTAAAVSDAGPPAAAQAVATEAQNKADDIKGAS
jgi:hypothetical protein